MQVCNLCNSLPTKDSAEPPMPKFCVGQVIAGSYYVGTIQSAFYAEGEWNYNIGENADIEQDNSLGYRRGPKYISEADVKWKQVLMEWEAV